MKLLIRWLMRRAVKRARRWRAMYRQAARDVEYQGKRLSTIHQEVDHDWKQTTELTRQRHEEELSQYRYDLDVLKADLESVTRQLEDASKRLTDETRKCELLEVDKEVLGRTVDLMAKQYSAMVARTERLIAMDIAKKQAASLVAQEGNSIHALDS